MALLFSSFLVLFICASVTEWRFRASPFSNSLFNFLSFLLCFLLFFLRRLFLSSLEEESEDDEEEEEEEDEEGKPSFLDEPARLPFLRTVHGQKDRAAGHGIGFHILGHCEAVPEKPFASD